MTRLPLLFAIIALGLSVVCAGEARAQDSKAVVHPPGVVGDLGQTNPDALIASQLWLAELYEREGRIDEAIHTYEAALLSILQFRGQGHISMAEPMVRVARLTQDPETRTRWLESAVRIAEVAWQAGDDRLVTLRLELARARQG
ncbi:hypothetical protein [Brevundimonas sp.]|uniref:hypothetical protein n=1 Tax=Brevundimonas sp. TaxID=1871086 RepID=UPI003AF6FC39